MMNMMTFPHGIIVIWINKCNLCNVCANGDKVWSWSVFVSKKKVNTIKQDVGQTFENQLYEAEHFKVKRNNLWVVSTQRIERVSRISQLCLAFQTFLFKHFRQNNHQGINSRDIESPSAFLTIENWFS